MGSKRKPTGQTRWWPGWRGWAWLAVVVVITAGCYVEIPEAGFVSYDDGTFVVNNMTLRTMTPVSKFFVDIKAYSASGRFAIYRAIPAMSYAVDYQISYAVDEAKKRANPAGKPDPAVFHTTNVVLHVIDAGLVYVLMLMLFGNPMAAAIGALMFGVHPVNTESVSWVTRRGNGFAVLFMLMGLILHVRLRQGVGRKWLKQTGVAACYGLSLLSQELGIILPGLLLAYDVVLAPGERRRLKELAIYYAPFVVVAALYMLLRRAVLGTIAQQGYYGDSFYVTMLTMTKVFVTYLRQLFVPVNMSVTYAVPLSHSVLEWRVWGSLAILGGLAISGAALWRKAPLYAFCVAWFFITLAPVSNVVPLQALQNDRFLYMTTVGLGLGLAGLLAWLLKRDEEREEWGLGLAAGVVLWVAVAGGGVWTFIHNRVWHDSFSLWSATAAVQPEAHFARTNLGSCYYERGEIERAIGEWKIALTLAEKPYVTANNLSVAYLQQGKLVEAEKMAKLAVEYAPEKYGTRFQLASVLEAEGRLEEAMAAYKHALEGDAQFPQEKYPANLTLARMLLARGRSGDMAEGLRYVEEAYRLRKDDDVALTLVVALRANGRIEEAKKLALLWYGNLRPENERYKMFANELRLLGANPGR